MEPVTFVVAALAAGAAAALKSTAEQAVKDAYQGVKSFIQKKYRDVSLNSLENKPESRAQQDSVEEVLTDAGANNDEELLILAKSLLDAVKAHDAHSATAIGIDLEKVEAGYVRIKSLNVAKGVGFKACDVKTTGGIDVEDIKVGYDSEMVSKKS